MEVGAEVAEGASRRRRYSTADEKRRIVESTISSSQSVASLARQHGVNANQLFYWRKLYHAGQLAVESSVDASSLRLLPVSVRDEEPAEIKKTPEIERDTHESAVPVLTLNIEIPDRQSGIVKIGFFKPFEQRPVGILIEHIEGLHKHLHSLTHLVAELVRDLLLIPFVLLLAGLRRLINRSNPKNCK
jgi:transposase